MSNQAVLNQAASVLEAVAQGQRADVALRDFFEGRRHGSWRERREIVAAVFAYFRWFQWLDRNASPQRRLADAVGFQERFNTDEGSIKEEALAARAVPDWLRKEFDVPAGYLRQLQREPALWIRARPGSRAELAAQLGDCEETELAPDALRYRGTRDLFQTPAFRTGAFEIQDLASQIVGVACAPNPGETWWDACAGEGGKTLHLAGLMKNKGVVWATDRNARRLDTLKRRAARAKLFNFRAALWDGGARLPNGVKYDGVLVDAPCSGVGTWQRNPHARWTTSEDDVRELAGVQAALLKNVSKSVKPGGKLVYAVCTLTRTETTAVADAFALAHPDFKPLSRSLLLPHELSANGMFIAIWQRELAAIETAGTESEEPPQRP